ncbi:MAG TPA: TonB-dependent receptor [Rhizomicrobium sp.]|jgi:outer membrane receptor protein involved in Fe transport
MSHINLRLGLLATAAVAALVATPSFAQIADQSGPAQSGPSAGEVVTVTAKRLDEARTGIQTQTGASTYTITSKEIEAQPGGENNLLNQVILQAPSVVQDSFGQLHVRGEHNALQYRLNGVIIPEGISVFGQTLDPRLASSVKLITGALPAEYGLITGGIVDMQTKSGLFQPGGEVSIYGGSHNTIEPSFDYGGNSGNFNYFVSGDYLRDDLGIESPDGSRDPIHDRTTQYHGFGYFEDILDANSRVTLIAGISHDNFQIPDNPGQPTNFTVGGASGFPSAALNENQREITDYGILSYLHSAGNFDFQVSAFGRYSSLDFAPDVLGDLEFNGIAQAALKKDTSFGVQAEGAWHLGDAHTIRGGVIVQTERATSATTSQVLPADCTGTGSLADPFDCAQAANDTPFTVIDNGARTQNTYSAYLQDEWKIDPTLTLNYGVRFDQYKAFASENQLSPRINIVWQPLDGTTVHFGYSRFFTPPPFELIASEAVNKFLNTTASPAITADNVSKAERANYFDLGVSQNVLDGLTLGVDSYYKASKNLIDEGQFGAPIILTPFNYKSGKQYGLEFTASYDIENFSAYANAGLEHAEGKDITSSQFDFDPGDLAYIADHFIHLDHEQYLTASAGASYTWSATRLSADLLYGSGLRKDGAVPNGDHVPGYTQVNLGLSHDFDLGQAGSLTARADVINLFDDKYEIRDGSGIGVGAPQWGPRRGFFFGLSKSI